MTVQDIYIYTIGGAILEKTIVAPPSVKDFDKQLCDAIDNGGAVLDTIDGTKIIINTSATAAVEISEPREAGASDLTANDRGISPPVENI